MPIHTPIHLLPAHILSVVLVHKRALGFRLITLSLFFFVITISLGGTRAYAAPFRIMLDPAGLQSPNRLIQNTQEKTITLNCAEHLKKEIELAVPNCTVILTRMAGQTAKNQEAASGKQGPNYAQRANTQNIDLFLSLNCYQETSTKPQLYMYQFLSSSDSHTQALTRWTGKSAKAPSPFTFYKEDQSYLFNHASSEKAAHVIQQIANQKQYASLFTTHMVIACPCAQLKGIIVPALVLDMGIAKDADWQLAIKPLISALVESIKIIAKQNS